MSTITSAILRSRYLFYKKHPEIAPVEANDNVIEAWATDNVLSLELPNNWEVALNALENRLAKNTARVEVQPAAPETPTETPVEPVDLRKLPVSELREIVKSQRVDFTPQLPPSYTSERIRKMGAPELRQLQTKYGSETLNKRLAGR